MEENILNILVLVSFIISILAVCGLFNYKSFHKLTYYVSNNY